MSARFRTLLSAVAAFTAVAACAGLTTVAAPSPAIAAGAMDVKGYVTHIDDGDTLDVDIPGGSERIRLTGMNAMELTTYSNTPANWRGDCHGVEAAKALYALAFHKTVRVVAQDSSSMSGSRYRRTVLVYTGGAWRDVSELMLAQGHGLFLSNGVEYKPNLRDAKAAQYAAVKKRGLFNTTYCGSGPSQSAPLTLRANWDAPGDDSQNVDGEYIRVYNSGSTPVPVGGWWVRDSAYRGTLAHGYTLPSGTTIPANGHLTVYAGKGSNTATKLYWGNAAPIFENATSSPKYLGDGGYLFDPQGDLRAWQQYPCRYAC